MKSFKPVMKDGHGVTIEMSPEAKAEWHDKPGKHAVGGDPAVMRGMKPDVKEVGVDGFDPGNGLKGHEASIKSKGKEQAHSAHDSGAQANAKHKTGPMQHAGKGASGAIKGMAGANKKGVGGAGH